MNFQLMPEIENVPLEGGDFIGQSLNRQRAMVKAEGLWALQMACDQADLRTRSSRRHLLGDTVDATPAERDIID